MKKAKRIMFILAMVLTLGTSTVPVMAHGAEHEAKTTYSQCTKKNCNKTGVHKHNKNKYCGNTTTKSDSEHKNSSDSKSCH